MKNDCPFYEPLYPDSSFLICSKKTCPILSMKQRIFQGYIDETAGDWPLLSFPEMRHILPLLKQRDVLIQREILKYFPEAKIQCLDWVNIYIPSSIPGLPGDFKDIFEKSGVKVEEYVDMVDKEGLEKARDTVYSLFVLGVISK